MIFSTILMFVKGSYRWLRKSCVQVHQMGLSGFPLILRKGMGHGENLSLWNFGALRSHPSVIKLSMSDSKDWSNLGDLRERLSRLNQRLLVWIPADAGMTVVSSFLESALEKLVRLSIGQKF